LEVGGVAVCARKGVAASATVAAVVESIKRRVSASIDLSVLKS
jgi:hypothetical protein